MRPKATVWLVILGMALAVDASAQTPRVVRHSGVVRDAAGQPRTGAATLTFGIYAEAEGGASLWTEVQAVTLDSQGRYAVALGATQPEGLPLAVFTNGEARWLGVAVDGGPELPRVALLSVPYALKAADTETIGGKPLSAFVLAGETTGTGADGLTYVNPRLLQGALGGVTPQASSGTPGYLGVFTNTTDLGNSVVFQAGSNIGINTAAPENDLHIGQGGNPILKIDGALNGGSGGEGPRLRWTETHGSDYGIEAFFDGGAPDALIFRGLQAGAVNPDNILVIRKNPGAGVGVGVRDPAAGFHAAATAAPGAFFDVYSNALGALPVVYRAARGTPESPSAVQTDDILGGLAVRGYGATGFSGGQGQMMFKAAENWTDAAHGTYLQLTTTPLGSGTWVERMRITPDGKVGIGTSTPATALAVRGDIRLGTSGTNGCIQNFAGTQILGTCSSDARLKTNVRPFEPVLDRVVRLRPVRFNWKAEQFPEYHFGAGLSSGLVAQEVEEVFPEMVSTDERGYKMVNYSELPYLTLAAVKELDATVQALKAENDALRAQLAALTERLVRLEKQDRH